MVSRGGLHVVSATSAAGVHSSILVESKDRRIKLLFDIGTYQREMAAASHVFISHGHTDHVGAFALHARGARSKGIIATYYVPEACVDALEEARIALSKLDGKDTPMDIIPLRPGESVVIGNNEDFRVMAFQTKHRVQSQGYAVYSKTTLRKATVKVEYASLSGSEIGALKKQGVDVLQKKVTEENLDLVYTGDTTFQGLLDCPTLDIEDLFLADIFIMECTYLCRETAEKESHLEWEHVHMNDIKEHADLFAKVNQLILTHISVRYGRWKKIVEILREGIPEELQRKTVVTLHEFDSKQVLTPLCAADSEYSTRKTKPGFGWVSDRKRGERSRSRSLEKGTAKTGSRRERSRGASDSYASNSKKRGMGEGYGCIDSTVFKESKEKKGKM